MWEAFGLGVCVREIGVLDDEGACGRELDQIWLQSAIVS